MTDLDSVGVTLLVTDVLDALHVPYLIGGSLASIIHGVVRMTLDADVVADLRVEHVTPFVRRLEEQFYVDADTVHSAIRHRSSFNLIHQATMFKVDVFIPKQRPFDKMQLERRTEEVVALEPERTAWIASAEDVVLAKLEWYRMGGEVSERQWRDVLGVVKMQGERLDHVYLRQWASALGVTDLLERALQEAQEP